MSAVETLAVTREIYTIIQDIAAELEQVKRDSKTTEVTLSRVIVGMTTALQIIKRASGGNEDVENMINMMQKAIQIANLLRMQMILLNAASGPWGLVFAGIGAIGTIFTMGDMVGSLA